MHWTLSGLLGNPVLWSVIPTLTLSSCPIVLRNTNTWSMCHMIDFIYLPITRTYILVVLCIVPGNCQYWRKHIFGRSPILLIERPTTHELCIIILLPLSLIQGIDHRLEEGWNRGAAVVHWLTKMCWPIINFRSPMAAEPGIKSLIDGPDVEDARCNHLLSQSWWLVRRRE